MALTLNSRIQKAARFGLCATLLVQAILFPNITLVMAQGESSQAGRAAISQAPVFILLGTSRVGNRYSAMLRHRDGSVVRVVSAHGGATSINGYAQFSVTRIESGRVLVQQPDDSPCVAYPGLGVGCMAVNLSELQLPVTAPATAALNTPVTAVYEETDNLADIDAEPGSFIESIQARALEQGEVPEIPPGMQLIESSSGYRLVPED